MRETIHPFILLLLIRLISKSMPIVYRVMVAGLDPTKDWVGADLHGMNLVGIDLRGYNLSQADLSHANLRGALLRRVNLGRANLSEARLDRADLSGAILRTANLHRTKLFGANLRVADLEESDLTQAFLDGADLRGASLNDANLHEARLGRVDFRGTQLIRANLSATNLRCADLRHAYGESANLSQCKLDGADLGNAKLMAANLTHASMQRVHGDGCNLSGACLNGADLRNSNFNAADFSNIHFEETLLTRTLLIGSQGISDEQQQNLGLKGAIFSEWEAEAGFTQDALDRRVSELEDSVNQLSDWAVNLHNKAIDAIAKLRKNAASSRELNQAQVLLDLANQIQTQCGQDLAYIRAYQEDLQRFPQSSEELLQEYTNINNQIVKVGNFIKTVQIILVDIPGFIQRSNRA
jgi:uncharacterized protein YjbI with pentapeptide repeats